jgi:hypothetical protein
MKLELLYRYRMMNTSTGKGFCSVVDPKLFFSDPDSDPIFVRVLDPDSDPL